MLLIACVAVIYLELFLSRTAGKTIANLIIAASVWGLLSLLAVWVC